MLSANAAFPVCTRVLNAHRACNLTQPVADGYTLRNRGNIPQVALHTGLLSHYATAHGEAEEFEARRLDRHPTQGEIVAYTRVSTFDLDHARQSEGVQVDRVFTDEASGKDVNRPQLALLLRFVREADTVVCHTMDRLGRNLDDLRTIALDLTGRGVHVRFVKESLTFSGEEPPIAKLLLGSMGAFAQFERELI